MTKIMVYRLVSGLKDAEVDAVIIGPLAVHRSIEKRKSRTDWKITHIETGGIVADSNSYHAALKCAKELAKLDWSKVKTRKSKKALMELSAARDEIVHRHGLT